MIASLLHNLPLASFWVPEPGSTFSNEMGRLFWFITIISVFFFCLITALLIYFVIRYRQRPGHTVQPSPTHNAPLEIVWSVIPTCIVILIFVIGYRGFLTSQTDMANAYEVKVVGQQWSWRFFYPNNYSSAELHLPIDRPIKLVLTSKDVIHSLSIPALDVRRDVVPGRENVTWFQPTKAGEFELYCTEYCGTKHSQMLAKVVVHKQGEFEPWLAEASRDALEELAALKPNGAEMLAFWRQNPEVPALLQKYPQIKDQDFIKKDRLKPMWEVGQAIYTQRCATCHDTTSCPSFKGLWKRGTEQVTVRDKGPGLVTVKVDDDYVRESVKDPAAKIVKDFPNRMSSFADLNDLQIMCLIEYIKKQE